MERSSLCAAHGQRTAKGERNTRRCPMASKHALGGTRVIKHPSRRAGWSNGVDCGGTSGGMVARSHGDQPSP